MSMFDCEKCWDHVCSCGFQYKDWKVERLQPFLKAVVGTYLEKGGKLDDILPPVNVKVCPDCGYDKIPEGRRFCTNCGRSFGRYLGG